jgi:hypothetical protein
LILKIIRHDSKGHLVKKETVQEINSESVVGRAWVSARWFNPLAPTDSFNNIGLLSQTYSRGSLVAEALGLGAWMAFPKTGLRGIAELASEMAEPASIQPYSISA